MAGTEVREIGVEEIELLAAVTNAAGADTDATAAGLVDWRRQAEDTAWLLAAQGGAAAGGAVVLVGWHSPRHIAIARLGVVPAHRGGGAGTALLGAVSAWARDHRASELESEVGESDADSLAWTERRGFREVGRESLLVLDLDAVETPDPAPPAGIEIATWAERPEVARGMYEVAREATIDIPGGEDDDLGSFDEWLSRDMQGESDRPEATFVAIAGDEVVGFAKLSLGGSQTESAFHDLTGVRRAWRGRGIAAALKRTQIAWAKRNGLARLETFNEERNEPIRRLNERHGYRLEPGKIIVRGPLDAGG